MKNLIEKNVQNGELVHYVTGQESSGKRQKDTNQEQRRDRQPDKNQPTCWVVDVITGGSDGRVTGEKRRGSLDSILIVSEQLIRRDRPYPDMVISFTDEDYPPESVEPHEGALVITA